MSIYIIGHRAIRESFGPDITTLKGNDLRENSVPVVKDNIEVTK